jgi:para-aminobenzoate synthetase / 4-amino-4-deoxychorismate lyase
MGVTEKPLTLETEALSDWACEPGFILLRDESGWRIYREPTEVLQPRDSGALEQSLARIDQHVHAGGEAAGFLRYEAGYALEPKLHGLLRTDGGPLCWFGLYHQGVTLSQPSLAHEDPQEIVRGVSSTIAHEEYHRAIEAIRNLIAAGDVYQINFTYRVAFQSKCDAWRLFAALCHRHPVPYAAFVNTGSEQIVSLSPELFFRIRGRHIVVKPMKGTADRGLTLEDDAKQGQALEAREKDRAENVMIVDLMRNDLGRVCRAGSVRTTRLFQAERFRSIWQMTSTIEGELRDDCSPKSIAKALFPSGSVTGAPKIRAMQVISELESSERGVYTGAIGYFAPSQAQFNVAIRTATMRDGHGLMGVGSGITYDSSSVAEWKECESKAAFLAQSAPDFQIIETLRWEESYWLLEEHLERMHASADYFGFPFDERKLREMLERLETQFDGERQRVRLLLSQDGSFEVDYGRLETACFGRVRLSARRTASTDRFLYHKTTHRKMYNEEWAAARSAKCDDALFLNERDELTEGAIHNLFLVKDGAWRTPAITSGLLAGTYRAYFLKNHPDAREEVLTLRDLASADAIYLCNSVRGMFPVRLATGKQSCPKIQADRC